MKINTKTIGAIIVSIMLVCSVSLFVRMASAEESPPRQVSEAVDSINRNQKRIAELKPLVEEFERLKADNNYLTGRLSVFGYSFDWTKNNAVKTEANPK